MLVWWNYKFQCLRKNEILFIIRITLCSFWNVIVVWNTHIYSEDQFYQGKNNCLLRDMFVLLKKKNLKMFTKQSRILWKGRLSITSLDFQKFSRKISWFHRSLQKNVMVKTHKISTFSDKGISLTQVTDYKDDLFLSSQFIENWFIEI